MYNPQKFKTYIIRPRARDNQKRMAGIRRSLAF
jgi:hypothetical protein